MAARRPIDHVVIIVKENHGFDNYFGKFAGADGDGSLPHAPNPPKTDPEHRHGAWLKRHQTAAKLQFQEKDIPAYYAYARQFTLCDRYFTDVAGPSTPNHLMLIAADSPLIDNPKRYRLPASQPTFNLPSLPASLAKAKRTWGNYGGYAFQFITGLGGHARNLKSDQFALDAAAGKLAHVSWVYAPHLLSEHAPDGNADRAKGAGNVTAGMAWTAKQVDAIVKGGLWPRTAIFITWDDWGGWYDHVDPPQVETWPADGTQFRYGSRVPCLVLSPYARKGYVSHQLHSHVSLVKFCETTFGLPMLNARDKKADDMSDCFDFNQKPLPPPAASASPRSVRGKPKTRPIRRPTKKK